MVDQQFFFELDGSEVIEAWQFTALWPWIVQCGGTVHIASLSVRSKACELLSSLSSSP